MPDGLTLAAFTLLVGLLYAWALQNRVDDRVAEIEAAHARRLRFQRMLDRWDEEAYLNELRFDVEVNQLLEDAA